MVGHFKKSCVKEAACILCRESGHKAGDSTCPGTEKTPIKMLLLSKDTKILSVISSLLKMGSRCFGITAPTVCKKKTF